MPLIGSPSAHAVAAPQKHSSAPSGRCSVKLMAMTARSSFHGCISAAYREQGLPGQRQLAGGGADLKSVLSAEVGAVYTCICSFLCALDKVLENVSNQAGPGEFWAKYEGPGRIAPPQGGDRAPSELTGPAGYPPWEPRSWGPARAHRRRARALQGAPAGGFAGCPPGRTPRASPQPPHWPLGGPGGV